MVALMIKLAILAAVAAAAPAQQFDLVCEGGMRFGLTEPYKPYSFRLRVDLDERRYCQDACAAILPIATVHPGAIFFEEEETEERVRGIMRTRLVNRESGEYIRYKRDRNGVLDVKAQCAPAAFSGFPELKTKF